MCRYFPAVMFLRATIRRKDGKEHRYFSVVENRRVGRGRIVQRHVLYLGEINDSQELAWRKSIEAFEDGPARPRSLSLFPEDRCEGIADDGSIVRLKLRQSVHGHSAPVGFRSCCGGNCSSIASGTKGFRKAVRARRGTRCCSCW